MKRKNIIKTKIDVGQELRNFGVLLEKNSHEIRAVAEQFGGLNKKLDSHTEAIGKLAEDMTIVKVNVEFLKGSLKKKVDYDEFLALERRMSVLESKVK